MSRRKFESKLELMQDLVANLEEIRSNLDSDIARLEFGRLESMDFIRMVDEPLGDLLISVETFVTNLDNGVYEEGLGSESDWE